MLSVRHPHHQDGGHVTGPINKPHTPFDGAYQGPVGPLDLRCAKRGYGPRCGESILSSLQGKVRAVPIGQVLEAQQPVWPPWSSQALSFETFGRSLPPLPLERLHAVLNQGTKAKWDVE
jgi:hypothetical protein